MMGYELRNGTITVYEDEVGDMLENYIDLAEKLHQCMDDIPKNVQDKIWDMVYRHYEP